MFPYKKACHIGSFIPAWFARHMIGDKLPIDGQTLEGDIPDGTGLVITGDNGHRSMAACVGNILKEDIFNAFARGRIIFPVIHDPEVDQLSLPEILYPDVLEPDIADQVAVAGI